MCSKKAVREERNDNIICDASIYKVVFVAVWIKQNAEGNFFFRRVCVINKTESIVRAQLLH